MIEVENLTKRYGEITAVNSISFTAVSGQVTGFLGPNGAGKTTTMRMLTGFMPPTEGKASVAGHDVFEESMEVRKKVGYLPENVPLYRDMTARGYLVFIAEIRGLRKVRQTADEALERVGLIDRADSRIRTLSKGMRQRVGLASALIHDPDVLILDEPTIGLDPLQVLELRSVVRELGRDHTLLFSTHILSEAEQVCDKVVIIRQGEIVAQGAPLELRSQLESGGRLLVRLENQSDDAVAALAGMDGVLSTEASPDGGVIVTPASSASDLRPVLAKAIVERGWGLVELRAHAVNLEEIFLELTRRETATDDAPVSDDEAEAVVVSSSTLDTEVDLQSPAFDEPEDAEKDES
jgi:ABC-2 type transport system ATP-binding protein